MLVKVARFSSARDAVDFAREARAAGWRVTLPDAAYPVTRASLCATLLGAVLGGLLFGTVGGLGELGLIRLRGLEPSSRRRCWECVHPRRRRGVSAA